PDGTPYLPPLAHVSHQHLYDHLSHAELDAEPVVGARAAATADTQVETALAQVIDRRDLFGDPQRMRERQDDDGHADPHARGARGHEGGEVHRCGLHRAPRVEVDLAEPHAVE